jgi:hypothetical protein
VRNSLKSYTIGRKKHTEQRFWDPFRNFLSTRPILKSCSRSQKYAGIMPLENPAFLAALAPFEAASTEPRISRSLKRRCGGDRKNPALLAILAAGKTMSSSGGTIPRIGGFSGHDGSPSYGKAREKFVN